MSRRLLIVLLPLTLLVLQGCGLANFNNPVATEQEVSQTFLTPEPPHLAVETFNGPIDVFVVTEDQVHARVVERSQGETLEQAMEDLENIDVQMLQDGDKIRITAKRTGRRQCGGNSGASAELQVPLGTVLELVGTNGAVRVTGRTGNIQVKTTNGRVHIKESRGELQLNTTNGSIVVEGGIGPIETVTTNGAVDIKAEKAVVTARTTNGSITFAGSLARGEQSFQSTNNRIVLTLPATTAFRLDAKTSNNRIRSEFPLKKGPGKIRAEFHDDVGENPVYTLKIRTTNGPIELKKGL